MDLLVLGGTAWLGAATARTAVARGHRVTALARGSSGDVPAGVGLVRADRARAGAYDEVADQTWDAVVEVGWQPDLVRSALDRLASRARHWVYVSSCSVYADDATPGTAEDAPLLEPHTGSGPVDLESYGPATVACERLCVEAMGRERCTVARAGLIAGYGDPSDRFGYWPARVARAASGGPVLTPHLDVPVQVVDVEDLAAWLVTCAENRRSGAYNAVGEVSSLHEVLAHCQAAAGRTVRPEPASDGWLAEHEVEPWAGPRSLPLWLPQPAYAGFSTRHNDAARAAGLTPRPLARTVAAALSWERARGLDRERQAGLTPAEEELLLTRLSR